MLVLSWLPVVAADEGAAVPGYSAISGMGAPGAPPPVSGSGGEPPRSQPIADDPRDPPARVLSGNAPWDNFGSRVVAVGDLNGDGAGELAVVSHNPWAVRVIVASANGFDSIGQITLQGEADDVFGASVTGGGDLNGDGYGDFGITLGRLDGSGNYVFDVLVYYGSAQLTAGSPSLEVRAPALPGSFGSGLAIVGDLDGDQFDDLVVSAPPSPSSSESGMVWVYSGSEAGVAATPDWSFEFPTAGVPFGAGAWPAGDLNRDGLGDFLVTTGGAAGSDGRCQIFVFYGDPGLAMGDPIVISGEQPQDGFGASVGYGDFNGDGHSDLIVGAPGYDLSGEQQEVGRTYEFAGSTLTTGAGPVSFRTGATGSKYASSVAGLGDVNGDGFDDAAVGAPLASADGPITNGQVFVYFGSGSGLSTRYDFTEAGESGNDLYAVSVAGRIDLDADGRIDLAVGAAGRDAGGFTDAGSTYLYAGLRIRMPAVAPNAFFGPELLDGKALARAPSPYRLEITFVYRGDVEDLEAVQETLVSPTLGARVTLSWDPATGDTQESGDSLDLVQVQPSATFTTASPLLHGYRLDIPVKFSWAFAEPRPVTLEVLLRDRAGVSAAASFAGAFSVVSTLAFGGALEIRRSDGGLVSPGQFVKVGDLLSWGGGHLVYTGTAVVPPVSEIRASIASESGPATALTVDGSTGALRGSHAVKSVEDPADLHTVTVRGTSGELLAQASVPIGIDATAPSFAGTSVASGTRLTENPAVVSVGVTDAMSGVGPGGVEWASVPNTPSGFADWQRAEVATGTDVMATASVPLSEGVLTWVQFRARDLVGNGFAYSVPLNLTLDYGKVLFYQVTPVPESWSLSSEAPVTISIANDKAVPLDFSTLEYLVIAGQSGLWTHAGLTGRGTSFDFTTTIGLPDGPRNALYLRIRLADRPETYQSPPFYIQVDTRPVALELVGPAPSLWVTGGVATSTVLITDSASGPLASSIRFRYLAQGTEMWSPWTEPTLEPTPGGFRAKGVVPVNDGVDNFVVWKAQDLAGNTEVTSLYQRILADSRSVGFERPVPGDGARLGSISRVSIDITDGDGSGVDLSTVEYKIDLPGGASTGWLPAGRDGLVTRATLFVQVALPIGASTLMWRAQDAAGNAAATSFPIHLTVLASAAASASPRLRLASPVSGVHYSVGTDVKFDAAGSSDPGGRVLTFRWSLDGALLSETQGLFWMRLAPGDHTLTVVVDDGASPPVSKTVRFTVDGSSGPPLPFSSAAERGMLATLAGLLGGALAVRLWAGRARRALRR